MKSLRVEFSVAAREDVDAIAGYLAEQRRSLGEEFVDALEETVSRLAASPGIGRPRPSADPRLAGMRSWPLVRFFNHIVFYKVEGGCLVVVRVLHGARDVGRILPL